MRTRPDSESCSYASRVLASLVTAVSLAAGSLLYAATHSHAYF